MASAIPYVGGMIMEWLIGGYVVCSATLQRFFVIHFVMPFVLVVVVVVHMVFVHEGGSSNPLGMEMVEYVPFHPYYT